MQLISVTTPVQNSSMYSVLADVILGLHLLFILWIVFGAAFTRAVRSCSGYTLASWCGAF